MHINAKFLNNIVARKTLRSQNKGQYKYQE